MYQAKYVLYFGNFKLSETIVTQWIIMAFLIIVAFLLTRNIQKVPTSKKQVFWNGQLGDLGTWLLRLRELLLLSVHLG